MNAQENKLNLRLTRQLQQEFDDKQPLCKNEVETQLTREYSDPLVEHWR